MHDYHVTYSLFFSAKHAKHFAYFSWERSISHAVTVSVCCFCCCLYRLYSYLIFLSYLIPGPSFDCHWSYHEEYDDCMNPLAWRRHHMETFSTLLSLFEGNPPVTDGFPSQRPVMRSFAVFFGLRLKKTLSKQSRGRWCETLSCSLWRHCNGNSLCKPHTMRKIPGTICNVLKRFHRTLNVKDVVFVGHTWNKITIPLVKLWQSTCNQDIIKKVQRLRLWNMTVRSA